MSEVMKVPKVHVLTLFFSSRQRVKKRENHHRFPSNRKPKLARIQTQKLFSWLYLISLKWRWRLLQQLTLCSKGACKIIRLHNFINLMQSSTENHGTIGLVLIMKKIWGERLVWQWERDQRFFEEMCRNQNISSPTYSKSIFESTRTHSLLSVS